MLATARPSCLIIRHGHTMRRQAPVAVTAARATGKAGIPRKQFPRSILVTCRRCRWHATRKSGVLDVSDEDATRILATMSATSRACRAGGIWRTTRHTDKRAAHTAADRRPTNQVSERGKLNGEVGRHARHPREDGSSCWRGCYEDVTRKLLPWNLRLNKKINWTSSVTRQQRSRADGGSDRLAREWGCASAVRV